MCDDCKARQQLAREALFNAKLLEAVKQVGTGIAEMAGLKEKTGQEDLKKKKSESDKS